MSYQYQSGRRECLGKECAWADKDGNCLIAKDLKQRTAPFNLNTLYCTRELTEKDKEQA
jgi:hypothetical protein